MNKRERQTIQSALEDLRAVREYIKNREQANASLRSARAALKLYELLKDKPKRAPQAQAAAT